MKSEEIIFILKQPRELGFVRYENGKFIKGDEKDEFDRGKSERKN